MGEVINVKCSETRHTVKLTPWDKLGCFSPGNDLLHRLQTAESGWECRWPVRPVLTWEVLVSVKKTLNLRGAPFYIQRGGGSMEGFLKETKCHPPDE